MDLRKILWAAALLVLGVGIMSGCATVDKSPFGQSTVRFEDGFVPSVEGKKLLHYGGPSPKDFIENPEVAEAPPFDGVIVGGYRPFYINERPPEFDNFVKAWSQVDSDKYTDNFFLCYSGVEAVERTNFDWFHEFGWIADNWRKMAQAAKDAGMVGICFDSEYYGGRPLFGYQKQVYAGEKSYEEYQDQVFKRGAEIMRAVNEVYPDITIIFLFGYSGTFQPVPQHPLLNGQAYNLVSAFVDGMVSEAGPEATIHDMHEQSFAFRVPGSYARARKMVKEVLATESRVPEEYRDHHRLGYSFWIDAWGNTGAGRAVDVEDFETNFYTPDELAYSMHYALAYSDKYVWMWPGAYKFWAGTVETADAEGNSVHVPIPEEYSHALERARDPHVPEPSRDRKPNTWRVESAEEWKFTSDEEVFGDLWDHYEFIQDMPLQWKFRPDPDEIGDREGWERPRFEDKDWRDIEIREWWEPQGLSPYDGCAWYRVNFDAPSLDRYNRVFLAFGAVADEATVFVNGQELYASKQGRNIRHQRFLVDVTDVIEAGNRNQVTVKVWNVSWCGGIWKNVKLIGER